MNKAQRTAISNLRILAIHLQQHEEVDQEIGQQILTLIQPFEEELKEKELF